MSTLGVVGGIVTLVLLVGLGIYAYPMLLKRRWGWPAIAVLTIALAALFETE
jgi:predicted ABC-type exoprotein transport system permease subunit